jgi:rhodanese-related sulfurtransferase
MERALKDALYEQLARVGRAVDSPKRLELLDLLAQGERPVDALAATMGVSVANTSAHLQALRSAQLVATRRAGTRIYYRLAGDDVARFVIALRQLAAGRLAEVEQTAGAYLGGRDDEEPVGREELLARLRKGDVAVLDVRPAEEYAAGHIPGSLSIPVDELQSRLDELPAELEVVAYCRGPYCRYSPHAVRLLRRNGRAARRLIDGFPEWRLAGLPVTAG